MDFLAVGLGGLLGSLIRYFFYRLEQTYSIFDFPLATLSVNIIGCLLMGVLTAIQVHKGVSSQSPYALFLSVGFLGSLTTFSAFAGDNYKLITHAQWPQLCLNMGLHLFAGLGALALGVFLTSKLHNS